MNADEQTCRSEAVLKVAAYQAPLLASGAMDALALIRAHITRCESAGVSILCCPEGILGGLADYAVRPSSYAINVKRGQLDTTLAPLASDTVTTIVGFTEIDDEGQLFNSAAIYHRGVVAGLYRKVHPAINKSVYTAGDATPVFTIGTLTFGIVICNDSNFPELAHVMAAQGATALFIPTNNGLPPGKAGPDLVSRVREVDTATATTNRMFVIRADVAGRMGELFSYGSSAITGPDGALLCAANGMQPELLVAEIQIARATAGG